MKLGLLTTLWGRPALAEAALRYYAGLEGVRLVRVAVRSPEDPEATPDVEGWHYVEHANEPLSDKWNAGVAFFEDTDIDALLITGSDDLFDAAYMRRGLALIAGGSDWVRLGSLYFYDLASAKCYYMTNLNAGSGRLLSRRALEGLAWQAWTPGITVKGNVDGAQNRFLNGLARHTLIRYVRDQGLGAVCIKGSEAIHPWAKFLRYDNPRQFVDGPAFMQSYFPSFKLPELCLS